MKVTKSKNKAAPNFIYKKKKYKVYLHSFDNETLELCLCRKSDHGNLLSIRTFNFTPVIEELIDKGANND